MHIPTGCYVPGGVIRKRRIPKSISICVCSRIIRPIVSPEIRTTNNIRPCCFGSVPDVVAVVPSVVRIVEVVVVDEVVVARRFQVDAVVGVRVRGVVRERGVARRRQGDAVVGVRSVVVRDVAVLTAGKMYSRLTASSCIFDREPGDVHVIALNIEDVVV